MANRSSTTRVIDEQTSLAVEQLGRVNDAYLSMWGGVPHRPEPMALLYEVGIRAELLDQLLSKRLPSLQRHLFALSNALLDHSERPLKPVSKLQLVVKVLSKIELTMNEIKFYIASISPNLISEDVGDDRDFGRLKFFRCCRLSLRIYEVASPVCEFLRTTGSFIDQSGHAFDQEPQKKSQVFRMTNACSEAIDTAIKYVDKSDINLIQDEWDVNIHSIDDLLQTFLEFIDYTLSQAEEESRSIGDQEPASQQDTQPQYRFAMFTSIIAILKLSRLLLAKLSRTSLDRQNFVFVSDLSSRELDRFRAMGVLISENLSSLVGAITSDEVLRGEQFGEVGMRIKDSITRLLSIPPLILRIVDYIFVPLVNQADLPSPKICFRPWFYQWNALYRLAVRNCLEDLGFSVLSL